jgi:hypothetical protein
LFVFLSLGGAFVSKLAAGRFEFFEADLGVPRFGGVMVAGLVVSFGMVILVFGEVRTLATKQQTMMML